MHDKLVATVILTAGGLLPFEKANCGVGFRESDGCDQQVAKCKGVAAVRHGRQQPGVLS
ncbi:MAG: hypothetical protein PVI06_18320 [Desulfobacterales bacterium]